MYYPIPIPIPVPIMYMYMCMYMYVYVEYISLDDLAAYTYRSTHSLSLPRREKSWSCLTDTTQMDGPVEEMSNVR